jgi:hypothetical protein
LSAYTVARPLVTNSFSIVTTGWVVTGWLEARCEAEEDIEHTMRPTRPAVWSCQREPLIFCLLVGVHKSTIVVFFVPILELGIAAEQKSLALRRLPMIEVFQFWYL